MEPEGRSPCLQEPATCSYSEPDQASPAPSIPLPEDPVSYYPPIYAWVFQVVLIYHTFKNILIRVCGTHTVNISCKKTVIYYELPL